MHLDKPTAPRNYTLLGNPTKKIISHPYRTKKVFDKTEDGIKVVYPKSVRVR
jgi:hypothetical protein